MRTFYSRLAVERQRRFLPGLGGVPDRLVNCTESVL